MPEQVYTNKTGQNRIYDEMWTADWWWDTQVSLILFYKVKYSHIRCLDETAQGATITPIILSSDKTKLSQFCGNKSAWPIYLTIGNIGKEIHCQPSAHATVLVGYLSVSKLDCFTKKAQPLARYCLFHLCMSKLLDPLVKARNDGVEMVCADGLIQHVFPILAVYVTNHPEQCQVTCCMENHCPQCIFNPKHRDDPVESILHDPECTLKALSREK